MDNPFIALHLNLISIGVPSSAIAWPTIIPVFVAAEAPAVPITLKCTTSESCNKSSLPLRLTLQAESTANLRTIVLPPDTPDIATPTESPIGATEDFHNSSKTPTSSPIGMTQVFLNSSRTETAPGLRLSQAVLNSPSTELFSC